MIISRYVNISDQDEDVSYIWHSVFGNPTMVSKKLADFLKRKQGTMEKEISITEMTDLFGIDAQDALETIQQLRDDHFIIDSESIEQSKFSNLFETHNQSGRNKVKYLSLIMSEECNFRCKYCIHFSNSNHAFDKEKFMTEDLARKAINAYIKLILDNNLSEAYINFGGGEPLMNSRTVLKTLEYIAQIRKSIPIPIKIGINTNASLITDDIASALISHGVDIAVSLDGLEKGNNSVRLSKNLNGTYDQIVKGIRILKKNGYTIDGFAMTVTEENFNSVTTELIDWAALNKMKEIRIDIDVVGAVNIPVQKIVNRLMLIRSYGRAFGINIIGFWSRPAENMGLDPEKEDVGFCGAERGNSLCVSPSGNIYPCGYSNYILCNIEDMSTIPELDSYKKLLQNRNLMFNDDCKDCSILGFCRGGCLITQEANKFSVSDKISRMCEFYRLMTLAIIRESAGETLT